MCLSPVHFVQNLPEFGRSLFFYHYKTLRTPRSDRLLTYIVTCSTFIYFLHDVEKLNRCTAARIFKKVHAKKTREIKFLFREIAFLVVLNFFPVQKLIFGHF